MPGRPPCPKCDARLLLVQVRAINDAVGMHRYECMNCDFVRENPTLEKAKPAGGWITKVKPAA